MGENVLPALQQEFCIALPLSICFFFGNVEHWAHVFGNASVPWEEGSALRFLYHLGNSKTITLNFNGTQSQRSIVEGGRGKNEEQGIPSALQMDLSVGMISTPQRRPQ